MCGRGGVWGWCSVECVCVECVWSGVCGGGVVWSGVCGGCVVGLALNIFALNIFYMYTISTYIKLVHYTCIAKQ